MYNFGNYSKSNVVNMKKMKEYFITQLIDQPYPENKMS